MKHIMLGNRKVTAANVTVEDVVVSIVAADAAFNNAATICGWAYTAGHTRKSCLDALYKKYDKESAETLICRYWPVNVNKPGQGRPKTSLATKAIGGFERIKAGKNGNTGEYIAMLAAEADVTTAMIKAAKVKLDKQRKADAAKK